MKKVLYIADPGNIHDLKWITWFSEQGEIEVYVVYRHQHKSKAVELANVNLMAGIDDYSVFWPWKNKPSQRFLNKIINEKGIDFVHIFYAEPNLLWANSLSTEIPIVLTTRGSDVLVGLKQYVNSNSFKDRRILATYQKAFNRITAVISTSFHQLKFLNEKFKLPPIQEIIRTGINIGAIQKPSQIRDVIFFPRVMQPLYRHELAIEAIVKLPLNIRIKYRFVFTNRNSENQEYVLKISELIKKTDLSNIIFRDQLNELEYFKLLAQTELVVMTPASDGSPVSGMEALAAGCKLVLPNLDYDQDLFGKAFFYRKDDVDSLAKTIVTAIESKEFGYDAEYLTMIDRNNQMEKVQKIYEQINR